MTLTFKRISEARRHLTDNGYASLGRNSVSGFEMYQAGPLVASIIPRPFKGAMVRIH